MITRSPVKPTKPPSGVPAGKRAPTPLRPTPVATATTSILTSSTATGSTTTPHEAMVASQLAHINDLVQNNRVLEQTIKKLNEELSKSAVDILALNAQRKSWEGDRNTWSSECQKWMDERKAWVEGCERMQAVHRIHQHRVACALHDERVSVLKMQEAARQEQLKRLQRDYKITMFQAREAELEERIDEVEQLHDEAIEARAHYEKVAQGFEERSAALANELKLKTAEMEAARKRCEHIEDDLRRLREAHADATATSTMTSSKLSRLTTERNSLDAQVTSLKRSLEVAQDETTQLRSQLANWQELKKSEDADAEEARKKRAQVEQELRDARKRIGELETSIRETDALEAKVQKQKDKLDRCKGILQEWQTEVREQTEAREAAEAQLTDAKVQITSLEQRIVELQAQLSLAAVPEPPSNRPTESHSIQSEEEVVQVSSRSTSVLPAKIKNKSVKPVSTSKPSSSRPADAPAKPRPKPRLVKNAASVPETPDSDIEILDSPPVAQTAPERSTKAKGKHKATHEDGGKSDVDAGEAEKPKNKGKTKGADKEVEGKDATRVKAAKRKKASPDDDTDEAPSKVKVKAGSKKRASPDPPKKSKSSSSQRNASGNTVQTDADTEAAPKKKKRKIVLFGGSQPTTFDWNLMTQNEEDMGIPRQLSPMKDVDVVPRRLVRASKG